MGLLDARAVLVRYHLSRASTFDRFRKDPDTVVHTVRDASAADVAFVAGDRETAHRAYLDRLGAAPDDVHSMVGLGLTRPGRETDPAARALLGRPELVRAAAARLAASGPVDILALAGWIGADLPPVAPDPTGWRVL